MDQVVLLAAAGLIGGFIAGLIGVGGGIIFVFILEEFLSPYVPPDLLPAFITANSLFAITFATLAANVELIRKKEFPWKQVGMVASISIPTSLVIQQFIVHSEYFSLKIFAIILLLVLMVLLIKQLMKPSSETHTDASAVPLGKMSITGLFGGIVAALTGLGGGVAMVPFMSGALKVPIHKAKAISLGVIMIMALTLTIANLMSVPPLKSLPHQHGFISLDMVIPLVLTAPLASPIGVMVARKLNAKFITWMFVLLILFLILKKGYDLIDLF